MSPHKLLHYLVHHVVNTFGFVHPPCLDVLNGFVKTGSPLLLNGVVFHLHLLGQSHIFLLQKYTFYFRGNSFAENSFCIFAVSKVVYF